MKKVISVVLCVIMMFALVATVRPVSVKADGDVVGTNIVLRDTLGVVTRNGYQYREGIHEYPVLPEEFAELSTYEPFRAYWGLQYNNMGAAAIVPTGAAYTTDVYDITNHRFVGSNYNDIELDDPLVYRVRSGEISGEVVNRDWQCFDYSTEFKFTFERNYDVTDGLEDIWYEDPFATVVNSWRGAGYDDDYIGIEYVEEPGEIETPLVEVEEPEPEPELPVITVELGKGFVEEMPTVDEIEWYEDGDGNYYCSISDGEKRETVLAVYGVVKQPTEDAEGMGLYLAEFEEFPSKVAICTIPKLSRDLHIANTYCWQNGDDGLTCEAAVVLESNGKRVAALNARDDSNVYVVANDVEVFTFDIVNSDDVATAYLASFDGNSYGIDNVWHFDFEPWVNGFTNGFDVVEGTVSFEIMRDGAVCTTADGRSVQAILKSLNLPGSKQKTVDMYVAKFSEDEVYYVLGESNRSRRDVTRYASDYMGLISVGPLTREYHWSETDNGLSVYATSEIFDLTNQRLVAEQGVPVMLNDEPTSFVFYDYGFLFESQDAADAIVDEVALKDNDVNDAFDAGSWELGENGYQYTFEDGDNTVVVEPIVTTLKYPSKTETGIRLYIARLTRAGVHRTKLAIEQIPCVSADAFDLDLQIAFRHLFIDGEGTTDILGYNITEEMLEPIYTMGLYTDSLVKTPAELMYDSSSYRVYGIHDNPAAATGQQAVTPLTDATEESEGLVMRIFFYDTMKDVFGPQVLFDSVPYYDDDDVIWCVGYGHEPLIGGGSYYLEWQNAERIVLREYRHSGSCAPDYQWWNETLRYPSCYIFDSNDYYAEVFYIPGTNYVYLNAFEDRTDGTDIDVPEDEPEGEDSGEEGQDPEPGEGGDDVPSDIIIDIGEPIPAPVPDEPAPISEPEVPEKEEPTKEEIPELAPPIIGFVDVDGTEWFMEYLQACVARQLVQGYPDGTFRPFGNVTRAELVQIMYNMQGDSDENADMPVMFSDLDEFGWYLKAVLWAARNKVVEGYGNGKFGPNDYITREQAIVLFWRWSSVGDIVVDDSVLDPFVDKDEISPWAKDAVKLAVSLNFVQGTNDMRLNPKGYCTRAELTALLARFMDVKFRAAD